MKAADIMTTEVITVSEDACVQDAANLLLRHRISAAPVVDKSGKLVGIISQGDLMRRAETGTQHHRPWWLEMLTDSDTLAREFVKENARRVADVMTRKVITARSDTDLAEIANLLEKNGIKRVPIVDDGRLVGIVSRANLVQAVAAVGGQLKATIKQDDAAIRERLLARLKAEAWSPSLLSVVVHNGKVDLWGMVDTPAQKAAARVAAESTPGVVAVNDNVIVKPVVYGA